MSVRPLTEEDAAALRALRLRGLLEEPDPFASSYEEEREWPVERTLSHLRAIAGSECDAVLGAFEESVLVGVLGIARERHSKTRHRVNLWGMYVAPEARGRGHGLALMHAMLERVRGVAGVEQVCLEVTVTNEPARRLYERLGFRVMGLHVHAMKDGDRYLDEELMVLSLGEAPV